MQRSQLACPLCSGTVLEPHRRAGIDIDICPQCRGVWLDRGELERLVDNGTSSPFMKRPDLEDRDPYEASDSRPTRSEPKSKSDKSKSGKSKSDKSKSGKSSSKKRKSRKKSWGELLGDALEEILD